MYKLTVKYFEVVYKSTHSLKNLEGTNILLRKFFNNAQS